MKSVLDETDMDKLELYPPDDLLDMLSTNLARMMSLAACLTQKANRASEVEKRYSSKLDKAKEDALRAVQEKEQLLEKFLESEAGKAALEAPSTETIVLFKSSGEFEELVLDHAEGIYEQMVQDCGRILHETRRISDNDLLLLDTELPFDLARDDVELGVGDSDDKVKREAPPQT
ncbi:hypothetical protein CDL12_07957 [Handroanthus impetiginosus]|uniref:Uncharacterized protein n=1 Tax=Handroanthus impetiginosus TaxID=429701 RepID=A0A2G9HPB6_9LAMI|nr:hypothetical protein CDL12_07957 [Handroanthus impetiginosus]